MNETPTKADLVIIGAGVIGLAAAYHAAKAGARVVVLDRGRIGGGASRGNAGLLVPSSFAPLCEPGVIGQALAELGKPDGFFSLKPRCDPSLFLWLIRFARSTRKDWFHRAGEALNQLNIISRKAHRSFGDKYGQDYQLRTDGTLCLYSNYENLAQGQDGLAEVLDRGYHARVIGRDEILTMEPSLSNRVVGAIHYQDDASLRPEEFVETLARAAEEHGAEIIPEAEAFGFRFSDRGVRAVRTVTGEIEADQFILACGAWLAPLGKRLGLKLPIEGGKGVSLTFDRPERRINHAILLDTHGAVTPFQGAVRTTGLLELCGLDESIPIRRAEGIQASVSWFFPWLAREKPSLVWRGLRPCVCDGLPIMGRVKGLPNVIVAGGHDQKGVSLSLGSGELIAALADGRPMGGVLDRMLGPDRFNYN